jgi:hypothetical protein
MSQPLVSESVRASNTKLQTHQRIADPLTTQSSHAEPSVGMICAVLFLPSEREALFAFSKMLWS